MRRLHLQPALFIVFAILFAAAWGASWVHVRDRVAAQREYSLEASQIEITPPPPWIRCDVKNEVLRDASLDRPLSLLDENLAKKIYDAFPLHPWIARVERVTKHFPARVKVDVAYRRPVCVVEVSGGVYPVDKESVLLPSGDFAPVDAARYPLLRGIDTQPGPVGSTWGDKRVSEGCRLADALASVWMKFQLVSLTPLSRNEEVPVEDSSYESGSDSPRDFELLTRGGSRIIWGRAPLAGNAEQRIVEAKISQLERYVSHRGSLDAAGPLLHLESMDVQQP